MTAASGTGDFASERTAIIGAALADAIEYRSARPDDASAAAVGEYQRLATELGIGLAPSGGEPSPEQVRAAVRDIRLCREVLTRVALLDSRGRRLLLSALIGADPPLVTYWLDWLDSGKVGQ